MYKYLQGKYIVLNYTVENYSVNKCTQFCVSAKSCMIREK